MRKILIKLASVTGCVAALALSWIFGGRQISLFLDQFRTIEITSMPIHSIVYEGSGTGGVLRINDLALGLNDKNGPTPNIGSTKDNQLAIASGGKVFAFGPLRPEAENLAAEPAGGDGGSVSFRRTVLSWPTPFDFNFMTGHSPSWKRHIYYQVIWKKPSGAKLEMLWRYEQYFYSGEGWTSGFMTRAGSTGLIRVHIHL